MKKDVYLLGIKFRCVKGHEWQSAVGGVWLQMPTCPKCNNKMNVPAVSWIGIWSDFPEKVAKCKEDNNSDFRYFGQNAERWLEDNYKYCLALWRKNENNK